MVGYFDGEGGVGGVGEGRGVDGPVAGFVVFGVAGEDGGFVEVYLGREDCHITTLLPTTTQLHLRPISHIHRQTFLIPRFSTPDSPSFEIIRSAFLIAGLIFN